MLVNIASSQMQGKCVVRRISLNFPFKFAANPGYTKASRSLSALCTMVQTNAGAPVGMWTRGRVHTKFW